MAGYVVKNGWDDFQAMADNGMTVPGANKAALEAVTTGEVGILVAAWTTTPILPRIRQSAGHLLPARRHIVNPRRQ